MSDGVHTDAVQRSDVRAVVYHGDKFVEVSEADVTLQDLSAAFELSEAVYLRERASGRTVATLPFEAVPLPRARAMKKEGQDEEEEESDDETSRGNGPVVYDIVVVTAAGSPAAAHETAADAQSQGGADGVPRDASSHSAAFAALLQELAHLGAVGLLSAELPQRLQTLDRYDETEAPGLLTRCLYPPSTYSPYRLQRDPLLRPARGVTIGQDVWYGEPTRDGSRAAAPAGRSGNNNNNGGRGLTARGQNEVQYRSSVDTYEVPDIEVYGEAGLWPSLQPLSDEERQCIFDAL